MPARSVENIAQHLKQVHFKRKLFGGVDEADVWRIIDKLQQEYAAVLEAQTDQFNATLDQWERYISYLENGQGSGQAAPPGGAP